MTTKDTATQDIASSELTLAVHGSLAAVFGVITGAAAGLIGVGGGEFRIPFLLYLFGSEVKTAAGVNLVVGLFTVCLAFIRRRGQHAWAAEDIMLAAVFTVAFSVWCCTRCPPGTPMVFTVTAQDRLPLHACRWRLDD